MANTNNITHVGLVVAKREEFKTKAPEKYERKQSDTRKGVLLAMAGVALLAVSTKGVLGNNIWIDRLGVGMIALGCLTASMEIIKYPVEWGIAKAKDIAGLIPGRGGA